MTHTLPVPRRRHQGTSVDTIKTLRLVHKVRTKAYQLGDEEMINCADTVLSAIVLGIKEPRQYVPDTVGYLINLMNDSLIESRNAK